jgi:hypothetical protein
MCNDTRQYYPFFEFGCFKAKSCIIAKITLEKAKIESEFPALESMLATNKFLID